MEDEKKEEKVEVNVEELLKRNEDLERENAEIHENLNQVAAERENYKKVALSKKGKSGGDDDESEEERISRIVREQVLDTKETELLKKKAEITDRALQENKELKVALKNRTQIGASAGQGGGQSSTDAKAEFWTPEQLAYFKKRNINPEKAKENYLKLKNN
jgi:hypothetical protein